MGTNEVGKVVHKGRIKVLTNFFEMGKVANGKRTRQNMKKKKGGVNFGPKLADSQGKAKR